MAQKQQKSVIKDQAKDRRPTALKLLIHSINAIDAKEEPEEGRYDLAGNDYKSLCKGIHELAQMASLPRDMRNDYRKAVAGTPEEWARFCRRLGVKLWRKWTEMDMGGPWHWPMIRISLTINHDGLVSMPEQIMVTALVGIEAKRLRECRVCWRIFWAQRIEKKGGPFGCSPECNNTLRQRDFKERKKLAEEDAKRRKKP